MTSTVSSIESVFTTAFRPDPLLKNFYLHVIENSTSFGYSKDKTQRDLNAIFHDVENWPEKVGTKRTEARKIAKRALRGLYIALAFFEQLQLPGSDLILSEDQFREKYPEFAGIEDPSLVQFRNCMAVALTVEEAVGNKEALITLCSILAEGSSAKKYVTGGKTIGGPKTATSRRVLIFETESGTTPVKRPHQSGKAQTAEASSLPGSIGSFATGSKSAEELSLPSVTGSVKRSRPAAVVTSNKRSRTGSEGFSVVSALTNGLPEPARELDESELVERVLPCPGTDFLLGLDLDSDLDDLDLDDLDLDDLDLDHLLHPAETGAQFGDVAAETIGPYALGSFNGPCPAAVPVASKRTRAASFSGDTSDASDLTSDDASESSSDEEDSVIFHSDVSGGDLDSFGFDPSVFDGPDWKTTV